MFTQISSNISPIMSFTQEIIHNFPRSSLVTLFLPIISLIYINVPPIKIWEDFDVTLILANPWEKIEYEPSTSYCNLQWRRIERTLVGQWCWLILERRLSSDCVRQDCHLQWSGIGSTLVKLNTISMQLTDWLLQRSLLILLSRISQHQCSTNILPILS